MRPLAIAPSILAAVQLRDQRIVLLRRRLDGERKDLAVVGSPDQLRPAHRGRFPGVGNNGLFGFGTPGLTGVADNAPIGFGVGGGLFGTTGLPGTAGFGTGAGLTGFGTTGQVGFGGTTFGSFGDPGPLQPFPTLQTPPFFGFVPSLSPVFSSVPTTGLLGTAGF